LRNIQIRLLRHAATIFGSLLSFLGVISAACGETPTDYGMPLAVYVSGGIESGGQRIQGIQVRMLSTDSTTVFESTATGTSGSYCIWAELLHFSLPDSVIIEVTDVDGEENGLFLPSDSLLILEYADPYSGGDIYRQVDFELLPDEE
jgi:hypothetical protein